MENLDERRKFIFLEVTRKNGDIKKAYAVCKESHKLKIKKYRTEIIPEGKGI